MATKTTGNYQIPFKKNGDQAEYDSNWPPVFWADNCVFEDTLTFSGHYGRGRSSVTFSLLRKATGTLVSFFVSDFAALVPKMTDGTVTGKFTFTKKGQNYGCRMIT